MDNGKILIYNFIISPGKAIEYLIIDKQDKYMGIALLVMLCGVILNLTSKAVFFLNRDLINIYVGIGGIISVLNFLGNLILFTAILFFINNFSLKEKEKRVYKNKNYAALFFKLICFSFIPLLFTPLVSLAGLYFKLLNASTLYYLLKTALYFWIVFLQILIIKKIFDLKTSTSIALYLLPMVGLLAFIFIKILNMGLTFISLIL